MTGQQRTARSKPKAPKAWVPLDADGQPVEALTPEQATKLRERCVSLCLWHLARTAKTRGELSRAMERHLVPSEVSESVLDQMQGYGYIDDAAYAQAYTRSRLRQRKAGPVIARELARKGVEAEVVAEVVGGIDAEEERANAESLAQARVRAMRHLPESKQLSRLVGLLSRRGYPPSVAWAVARATVHGT